MSQPLGRHVPAHYQFRVDGHLDAHWSPWFDNPTLTQQGDGTTTLTGLLQDQSQLHGLLAKMRDLGLILVSIRVLDEAQMDDDSEGLGW